MADPVTEVPNQKDKEILNFHEIESGGENAKVNERTQESLEGKTWVGKRAHVLLKAPPLQLRRVTVGTLHLQVLLMILGLAIFAAMMVQAFETSSSHYIYSSPLTAMWMGLGVMWFSFALLVWWIFFCPSFTRAGHYFWAGSGAVVALLGFICMVSHAAAKNEGAAAGCALLWIAAGVSACATSTMWIMEDLKSSTMRATEWCKLSCCCNLREWAIGFGLFLQLWMFVFLIGCTVQAASASAEYAAYPPSAKSWTWSRPPT
mmetsp:Transcript_7702/g.17630  ORF Transcript_7702/g.17630 Transcript_7702/m.17630 type:complete len:261 (-) Transcript_7702:409-1191(-)